MLDYPPFAASLDLEQAARNNPPLRLGARGTAVALLQGALLDLNFKLPDSTRKLGKPDGLYGSETERAWDGGKKVTIFKVTVTDQFMGEFHRQGLASEYNCFGAFKRHFSWKTGEKIARAQLDRPPGGRGS